MSDDPIHKIEGIGGILLAHTALLSGLFTVLRAQGMLSAEDLDTVFDSALVGVESNDQYPTVVERDTARRYLENMFQRFSPLRPNSDLF
jgi:hypothetical protein